LHMDADQNLLTATTEDRARAMEAFRERTTALFTGD